MIAIMTMIMGLIVGGGCGWLATTRIQHARTRQPLEGVKWEKTGSTGVYSALHNLRRHYPTHDFVTGARFLDLVRSCGRSAESANRTCREWTVAMVMIDKRTQAASRIILRSDDPDADEKSWILRRAGFKVMTIEPDVDEDGMRAAMAA